MIAAVPPRDYPRDALIAREGAKLADLPPGARVGTGSPRRAAQLLGLRGDLWMTGSRPEAAADPRATISFRSHPGIEWHVAAGLGHQPAVFLIPLPGIAATAARTCGTERSSQPRSRSSQDVTSGVKEALVSAIIG